MLYVNYNSIKMTSENNPTTENKLKKKKTTSRVSLAL